MAQKYGFFNSVNNDRVYDAADFAGFLSKFFTNGIFNNSLAVNSNDNMTISISTGSANINGYGYENTDILTFDIEEADSELNRIDSVIVRLDLTNRQITTMILEGAYATTPSQPNIIRSGNIYDLRLANISVPSGTTRITKDLITDTRFSGDCGNVIQAIQSPDLTEMLEKCTEQVQNAVNNIKGILDGDIAGNLINSINDINDKLITTEICTNEELQTALNNVNENSNDVLKDNKENILDPIIPRYEVCKYNLITDGPAVKTGRKVDDKWEWVKRVSISTNSGENLKNVYLPLNIYKILNIKCMAISNSSNSFKMPSVDAALCNIFVRNNGFLDLNMGTGNFEQGSAEVEIFFREI